MGVGELRIRGTVHLLAGQDWKPVEGAYVSLNSGETFIAERRTGPDGIYEFHITPGEWGLVCRAAGALAVTTTLKKAEPGELEENFYLVPVGN